ncbi:DNA translocase FtsK [Actibacterium lipolyticum]|uniref:DNA translocase FtsK n=1 Tax=Actibacterium lipolyticum TaxID=1524263 RepID=A0A238KW70_9RHOB|nr:DNA translocase FtsK [Actibacterium lipolyticum]SMX46316.1 DNA translocase FtsK [Actibacterium lipolyticum]
MASYQMKHRDPLFDTNMQAAIERRGKELLGVALIAIGIMVGLLLASYVPEDPSWLSATDEPTANYLGRFGASIASPLNVIVGLGAWGLSLVFIGWGVRFVLHRGEERALGRVIFAPIAIAVASVYATTLTPSAGWTHEFGMGGLFGETVLGAILNFLPIAPVFGLKLMAFVSFFAVFAIGSFVLGFDRQELKTIGRFLLVGLIMAYATLMTLLGRGASEAVRGVHALKNRKQAQKKGAFDFSSMRPAESERMIHRSSLLEDDDEGDDLFDIEEEEIEKPSLLGRMPSLIKRVPDPAPELVEPELPPLASHNEPVSEERIKARIADVMRNRMRKGSGLHAGRAEPPLQGGRVEPAISASNVATAAVARRRGGPQPLIADKAPRMAPPPQPLAVEPDLSDAAYLDDPYVAAPVEATYEAPLEAPIQVEETNYAPEQVYSPPAYEPPPVEARRVVQPSANKTVQPSRRAKEEAQPALQFEEQTSDYEHPPLSLLASPTTIERHQLSDEALEENARMLENVLDDYGVKGEIVSVRPGPVVTMYELEPAPGLKASRVIGLADDIARSMSALSARVSTVPGRSVIGIELPNVNREKVVLREILSARDFGDGNQKLPLALGKDIGGDPIVANLAKMPHLLIAGTTGSGKSVAINTMILSLLYKLTPDECRLIMIDPKMLELSVYDGIPHLLSPVVTDPKKAVVALKWVVGEMEERYRKMSKMGVRNIDGYNGRVKDALAKGEMFSRTVQTGFDDDTGEPVFETEEFAPKAIPYIVVIVDEMADLMMVAGKEIEACIQRLAQMARASGIHLIMATQRPSVDVITGTIKANFPTRISFQVTGKIDSRTILGEQGAEQLLGMGDMLYMAGGSKITRVHGPFCSDEEVEEIVNYLKAFGPPEYMSGVVDGPDESKESDIDAVLGLSSGGNTDMEDALYDTAVAIVLKDRKCSTSYIQRKLSVGYNKAAKLVEQMEEQGVVSAANHVGKREILVPEQQ